MLKAGEMQVNYNSTQEFLKLDKQKCTLTIGEVDLSKCQAEKDSSIKNLEGRAVGFHGVSYVPSPTLGGGKPRGNASAVQFPSLIGNADH